MLFIRLLIAFIAFAVLHGRAEAGRDVLLLGVGGNSECFSNGGIKKLFNRAGDPRGAKLATDLLHLPNARSIQLENHYFSWTGDPEKDEGCITKNPDWVLGGSDYIRTQLKAVAGRTIVIIGWSNGGATAYELACLLEREKDVTVSLLVTLDPAAWTTTPCPTYPARRWIGVYTKSDGLLQKLRFSNIIAYFGAAWNNTFPTSERQRAHPLFKLEPAEHGDTVEMWRNCVLNSDAYREWVRAAFGQYPLNPAKPTAPCDPPH